ncbi:MAG: hypothetical protein IMZ70_08380 [Candidatus Atribacteria bacterium]|nr:hypothetical protein [Candidatus Atribacteria bacterium]
MLFKIGQLLRLINNTGMCAPIGAIAKIVYRGSDSAYGVRVKWISGHTKIVNNRVFSQMDGVYANYHFVPVLEVGEQLLFDFMKH